MEDQSESIQAGVRARYEKIDSQFTKKTDENGKVNALLNHRKKAIAYLAALGFSKTEIAKQLGVTPNRVGTLLSSTTFRNEVDRIQEEIFLKDPQKVFMKILPKAITRAYDLMMSKKTKDSVAVDASFKFMDRALGKAIQQVKHEGGESIRDLLSKVEEMERIKNAKAIEVAKSYVSDAEIIEVKKDPFDQLLEDL